MRGLFIALEGIDGAGKTTALTHLLEHLNSFPWYSLTVTHEPTSGPLGQKIYGHLLGRIPMIPPLELQELYVRDRKQHVDTLIRPLLAQGGLVISDRYWLSTLSHGMLDAPKEIFIDMHEKIFEQDFLIPDITFILDLLAEQAVERLEKTGRQLDHFEKLSKQEKIRANFLELARVLPEKNLGAIHVIDVSNGVSDTSSALTTILEKLEPFLSSNKETAAHH